MTGIRKCAGSRLPASPACRGAPGEAEVAPIAFVVPVATKSVSNLREHWATRAKRVKRERMATFAAFPRKLLGALSGLVPGDPKSLRVSLTRISPRELDDDNLRPALKAVRDEIARLVGVDDRDPRIQWVYPPQEKGKPARVVVTVEAAP